MHDTEGVRTGNGLVVSVVLGCELVISGCQLVGHFGLGALLVGLGVVALCSEMTSEKKHEYSSAAVVCN